MNCSSAVYRVRSKAHFHICIWQYCWNYHYFHSLNTMSGRKKGKQRNYNINCITGREIQNQIELGRRQAYDQDIIAQRQEEEQRRNRRKLNFPHLAFLLNNRLRDDSAGRTDQGMDRSAKFLEIFDPSKNIPKRVQLAKEQYKKSLLDSILCTYKERNSLSFKCADVIAQHLDCKWSDMDHVQWAVRAQPTVVLEYFSFLCCKHNVKNKKVMSTFTHEYLQCERMYLGEFADDESLTKLSPIVNTVGTFGEATVDDWEDLDLSDGEGRSSCSGEGRGGGGLIVDPRDSALRVLYIFKSNVTFEGLSCNAAYAFGNLRSLCLFDVELTQCSVDLDPAHMCLAVLQSFSAFQMLEQLDIVYCAWVNLEGFRMWGKALVLQRNGTDNEAIGGIVDGEDENTEHNATIESLGHGSHRNSLSRSSVFLTKVNVTGFNWFTFLPSIPEEVEFAAAARLGEVKAAQVERAYANLLYMSVTFDAAVPSC